MNAIWFLPLAATAVGGLAVAVHWLVTTRAEQMWDCGDEGDGPNDDPADNHCGPLEPWPWWDYEERP